MFSTKNLSPQSLSIYTALLLSLPIGFGFLAVSARWWIAVIALVVTFVGSYLLIQFTLERFIYRKIKLIYKFIYQTKASKREETYYKYILPQKSIDEVRDDVERWAEQKKQEIEILKNNEVFRKEFLQNLAHEFKTPIFAIQGYVHTLLEGALEDKEVNRKFLENTSRNVDRMVTLVKDLDEISRLESGEQPLHKETFVIQDLVKEVFDSLSIASNQRRIRFSIKKGCETPTIVFADREKIGQVITNLVSNAIKYGNWDSVVSAGIYVTDSSRALVEISDDGLGIAEEHLPRVFERFYRVDRTRNREVGGSGLGLAIAKHIVEAHGQSIHIRSKLNVGTTVGFTLDLK